MSLSFKIPYAVISPKLQEDGTITKNEIVSTNQVINSIEEKISLFLIHF